MNKSSTEWKCCGHKIEDYDCPCFHEGWITGNSEPPLKEQEKWDTATQGDELSGNPGKLGDEQIQTKGVTNHPEKDRYKDQIAYILANRYGLILLPAVDELAALFPVEGESKEKHLTGDDSMKEQISKILIKWNMPTRQVAINEIVALFQSQESKTLERVRELKVPDDWNHGHKTKQRYKNILHRQGNLMDNYNQTIDDVLAILEAEQKGSKNEI